LNKDNTVRMLDNVIAALRGLRQAVADENEEELAGHIKAAVEARAAWQAQRQKADWGQAAHGEPLPTSGEILGHLFTFGKGRKPGDKDKKKP
jgi:hypothetical protein